MSKRAIAALLMAATIGMVSACSGNDDGEGEGVAAVSATPADPSDVNEPKDNRAESAKPDKKGRQTAVLGRVEGSKGKACIDTDGGRDLRAGQFVAGPFDEAVAQWDKPKEGLKKRDVRLYWVPLHSKKMPGITVVATHSESGEKVTVSQDDFGDAEQWKYYNVVMNLPQNGTWTLRGTAGEDRGCFKVTVG